MDQNYLVEYLLWHARSYLIPLKPNVNNIFPRISAAMPGCIRMTTLYAEKQTLLSMQSEGQCVSHLCTSMVSIRRQATQAQSMLTWLQKTTMPMKKPAPRIRVSAGWAYSACMPNGDWGGGRRTEDARDSGLSLHSCVTQLF